MMDPGLVKLRPAPGTEGAGRAMALEDAPFLFSSNITSDRETGAGNWSDDEGLFVNAMRSGFVGAREVTDAMPWALYGNCDSNWG